jgi:hypothetical protein
MIWRHFSFEPMSREAVALRFRADLLVCLQERWKALPFPYQMLLQEHLACYGLDAADHATFLLERAFMLRTGKQ